ncbi:MAG: FtsX-like permease family protein, partial [Rikenellaceae bacterium]
YLFKVGGIYLSAMGQSESQLALCDVRALRRIVEWEPELISGYEIWLSDESRTERFRQSIESRLLEEDRESYWGIGFFSYKELYPAIFSWLATHDVNAVVVIVIMLLVAIFNMTTALLILVLERTSMVGVLKTIGMKDSSIGQIFVYQALSVILRGILWGNVGALLLCMAQQRWGIITLDSEGYLLSQVPIELKVWWIACINIVAVAVIGAVMIIPSRFVSRIEPCESMKFN